MVSERFDFVVYGASGYTGAFIVKEVARKALGDKTLTWAIAGRSKAKLVATLKAAESELDVDLSRIEVILANTDDYESLAAMAARAKVILNCVGPYWTHGQEVVRACVENGTSHVDMCGEQEFTEKMELMYNQKAKESGAYIVGGCGFGYVPDELALIFAKEKFPGKLAAVEIFSSLDTKADKLAVNYGTYQSMLGSFGRLSELRRIRRQMPKVDLPKPPCVLPRRFVAKFTDGYYYTHDENPVIARTQRDEFLANGTPPVDVSVYNMAGSLSTLLKLLIGLFIVLMINLTSFGQRLLLKYPRLFTLGVVHPDGPPMETVKMQRFHKTVCCYGYASAEGQGQPDKRMTILISGPDPAYVATSSFLVESAYTLVRERNCLPDRGGVMTPGFAFRKSTLIERLRQRDIKFEVISTSN